MIPIKKRAIFYEKLERLVSAGNPLDKSLSLCKKGQSGELGTTIDQLIQGVESSIPLAKILSSIDTIPFQEKALLDAGFQAGKLPKVLSKLTQYLESLIELQTKFFSTVVPNILLLEFALLVMPTIQAIASNSSPMAIASFILQYLALFNAIVFIIYLKSNLVLKFLSPILLKIPVISSILKNYEIYKFALIYSQCVDAGLPVAQSFKASLKSLFPTPLKHDFENAAILASDGLSFFETLYNSSHIPFESVNQWEIGHQSGKEEQALEALSSRSLKDTLNQLGILSWLLQKAILAVVALTIFLTMKSMIGERFNMLDDLIQ